MARSPFVVQVATLVASAYGAEGSPASPVAMPVPRAAQWHEVGPFGLWDEQGQRFFRRSLEIVPVDGQPLELLAMCKGEIVRIPAGYMVGPGRTREGVSRVTRKPGLLLTVSPIGPILAALTGPSPVAGVLELPEPKWIVYEYDEEALSPDPALEHAGMWEVLDKIPVDFPADDDPSDSEPAADDPEPDDLLTTVVVPFALLPDDLRTSFDAALGAIADRLAQDPSLEVLIEGHTDTTGREQDNEKLSVRRARMIRRRLVQLLLQRDQPLEWADWMAVLKVVGLGETDPWFLRDADEARRSANRRVEVKLRLPLDIKAGQRLGTVSGPVTITVLDGAGRVLDPLDLVRRYDILAEFIDHPLAVMRDPMAPAIASGWVHVLSPDPASQAATDEDAPFFFFPDVASTDDNPLATILTGPQPVEAGDIIWIVDQDPEAPPIPTEITIDRPISIVTGGATLTGRPTADVAQSSPMISIGALTPPDVGVRLSLLSFEDGSSVGGGAAIRLTGAENVHIAGCNFVGNEVVVAPSGVNGGGAIYLENCRQVLIEDCSFEVNTADEGGALYADGCEGLVVAGAPLAPGLQAAFSQFLQDPSVTTVADPSNDPREATNYPARFESNTAEKTGGAVMLRNTRFRIVNCAFTVNEARVAGGAVAAFVDEPARVAQARDDVARGDWPSGSDRLIESCLALANQAPAGAAFALGGTQTDLRVQAQGTSTSRGGGLFEVTANLILENGRAIAAPTRMSRLGGGLCLASGVFTVYRNRISANMSRAWGGGVACIGNARVVLTENVIDRNEATVVVPIPDPPGDLGVPGGGGIYVRGFGGESGGGQAAPAGAAFPRSNRTVVHLRGNTIRENTTQRDGGGLLVTCGALAVMGWNPVERSPDIPVVPNTFQGNQASWYGGAISVRNADLEIWAGEALVANGAVRDGGALFVGGTIAYANRATAPFQSDASYRSSANLPAARGARLHVSGTDDEPVLFDGNHAESSGASHGGALFLYQEPLTPVDYPTPPITAGNFSVGLLRSVLVRGAHFVANRSDEDESGLVGSTITTLGLNHRWRQDYPGPDFVSALNDILAGEPLGPYDLQQLDIELDRGIGIYVLNSEAPDIDLRLPPHSAIRQSAGNPEGQGWGPTILNNSATRSVDP